MRRRLLARIAARSGVYIITGSLFLSGILRVAGGADWAIAQAEIASATPPDATHLASMGATDIEKDPRSTAETVGEDAKGLSRLVEALTQREKDVALREAALEKRMVDLAAAEQSLAENLEVLRLAEQRLEATLARADGAMEGDIAHLTKVYETMKPKDAATLFSQMDPKFAAGFLARMTPAAASGVMANMAPETAYAISLIFAGRHVGVPRE